MIKQFLITIFLFTVFFTEVFGQDVFVDHGIPRDSSYTLFSAWMKLKDKFPLIRPVQYRPHYSVFEERNIVYATYGKRELHLDIFAIINLTERKIPAIVLIHGGGWRSGSKEMEHPLAKVLAMNKYAAITVEYRLSPEAKYPAGINDIKEAIRWIKVNADKYGIDSGKIIVMGNSAGGTLAALIGVTGDNKKFETGSKYSKISTRVHAIVDIDGILDFTDPSESGKDTVPGKPSVGALWFGVTFKKAPQLWREASPVNYVSKDSPPILFINSSQERFRAGKQEFELKLSKFGIYHESAEIQNSPHTFWLFHPWFTLMMNDILPFLKKVTG